MRSKPGWRKALYLGAGALVVGAACSPSGDTAPTDDGATSSVGTGGAGSGGGSASGTGGTVSSADGGGGTFATSQVGTLASTTTAGGNGGFGVGGEPTTSSGSGGWGGIGDPDGGGGSPPAIPVCGDGWRDPTTEECDEGANSPHTACTPDCVVTDIAIAPVEDAGVPALQIDNGVHPIAAGPSGFGAAFTDYIQSPTVLWFLGFSAKGDSLGPPAIFSTGTKPAASADPVLASLPSGKLAAAWVDMDGDGDGLGIALSLIDPANPGPGNVSYANTTTFSQQYEPDILWTPTGLVVAWVDDSNIATDADIRFRTFDANLIPTSGEQILTSTTDIETDVALASFGSSWAAAWRASSAGFETLRIAANGLAWDAGPFLSGPENEKPSLVELDATHLLAAVTVGDAQDFSVTHVALAILDGAQPGTVMLDIGPPGESQPALVRSETRLYLAWCAAAALGDPAGQELWITELAWDSNLGTVTKSPDALALPRLPADRVGNQRHPRLASTPLFPEGAIVAGWDDLGAGANASGVRLELMPTPILRKAMP